MAILCAPPDPALGVVLRLSRYLDCEGRALGENGFQALIGSAAWTSILLAAVTIFVALIGYRMMLGRLPSMGDGIGWAVRLGIVLTLVTGWSAFQALFYQLSVDGPREIAATILPPARLSPTALPERLQDTYDRLRLGAFWTAAATPPPASDPAVSPAISGAPDGAPPVAVPFGGAGQTRLPQTALLLAITTAGVVGGLEWPRGCYSRSGRWRRCACCSTRRWACSADGSVRWPGPGSDCSPPPQRRSSPSAFSTLSSRGLTAPGSQSEPRARSIRAR